MTRTSAALDGNSRPTLTGVSSVDGVTVVPVSVDPTTGRVLVDLPTTGGTVTSVSVVSANGLAGTVATATSTPAITLSTTVTGILSGNGTTISAATTTGSGSVVLASGPTLVAPVLGTPASGVATNLTGTAAGLTAGNVTTNANLTGVITSVGNATSIASQTGTGTKFVVDTSPTLVTPTLTTPAAFTTGGTITLAENTSIALDPAGSADGKYTGLTVTATAGYTQAFGDLVYIDPTDSRWEATDANSAAGADGDARGILGMVVSAGTDGTACTVLLQGIIRADAKFPTFTVNNPIYVSETAGLVTQTQPTTTDVVIRVVGFGLTADEMYFNPSSDYITHT